MARETDQDNSAHVRQERNVEEIIQDVMTAMKDCQKANAGIQGWEHYRDYSGVRQAMDQVSGQLTSLFSQISAHQGVKVSLSGIRMATKVDLLKDANDALLEKVNSDVDDAAGLKRAPSLTFEEPSIVILQARDKEQQVRGAVPLPTAASRSGTAKPQVVYGFNVDNSADKPFVPALIDKPNNLKPLSVLICLDENGKEYYSHPYEYELQHFQPKGRFMKKGKTIRPHPVEETTFVYVETEDALKEAIEELRTCTEIAVDLEHHNFRSYQGFTCLIQISSRSKDYIFDPFPLRNKLTVLNEILTNPNILKVFHGSDSDVEWLQKDFSVYVVNMFDTYVASALLDYPQRSYAFLLHKFCGIRANKAYQRADWRQRPLPDDFISYARQDTHFLLYMYDNLRKELISKGDKLNNLLSAVYSQSTQLCLKRYEKPSFDETSHVSLYVKSKKHFNSRQMFAFRKLYEWRDKTARNYDESCEYALPSHMLLKISEVIPKEVQGIFACCNPVPSLVRSETLNIHMILRETLSIPATVQLDQTDQVPVETLDDLTSVLVCKHDLSQVEENTSMLSTLMEPQGTLLGDLFVENPVVLSRKEKSDLFNLQKDVRFVRDHLGDVTKEMYLSPYDRYRLYLDSCVEEKKPTEDEVNKMADDARINGIRQHFLNLATPEQVACLPASLSDDADEERVKRLREHFFSLMFSPPKEDTVQEPLPQPVIVEDLRHWRRGKRMAPPAETRRFTIKEDETWESCKRQKRGSQRKPDTQGVKECRENDPPQSGGKEICTSGEEKDTKPPEPKARHRTVTDHRAKQGKRAVGPSSSGVSDEDRIQNLKEHIFSLLGTSATDSAPQTDGARGRQTLKRETSPLAGAQLDIAIEATSACKKHKNGSVKAEDSSSSSSTSDEEGVYCECEEGEATSSSDSEQKPFEYETSDFSIFTNKEARNVRAVRFQAKFRGGKQKKKRFSF